MGHQLSFISRRRKPTTAKSIPIVLSFLAAISAAANTVLAADATMRLRGGQQTFTGKVISFDGYTYRIETEMFGIVNIDLKRFECVAGACAAEATKTMPNPVERTGSIETPPPTPENADSTASPTSNKLVPGKLTDLEKLQFFRDFLEWKRSQSN